MEGGMADPVSIVVVGASAGGVEALKALTGGLPPDLPATVLVVLHLPRASPSALPAILDRVCPLPVRAAVDGDPLRPGVVLVAPADRHLLVIDGRVRLSVGPTENGHRPAVDPLFRSAARGYGPAVIGVVLSGARDDGASGAAAIARQGGVVVVQDPDDALHSSMPKAAIAAAAPQHVVGAAKLGPLLGELARSRPVTKTATDELLDAEVRIAEFEQAATEELAEDGSYGCPSCGGSLVELPDGPVLRYRCRIGHAWSAESLLFEQDSALEGALWMALRSLEEKATLHGQMAAASQHRGASAAAARHSASAQEARRSAALVRRLISQFEGSADSVATEAGRG
jgi:two-component system, chemotaxis family, protein-glutamate methylesterase/glutaminase